MRVYVLAALLFPTMAATQDAGHSLNAAATGPGHTRAPVPTHVLNFHADGEPLAGVEAPSAFASSTRCLQGGVTLLTVVHPSDPVDPTRLVPNSLFILGKTTATPVDASSVRDIDIADLSSPVPSGTGVAFTVYGRRKVAGTAEKPPRRPFVIFFDAKGSYEKAVELQTGQAAMSTALLPTGDFVIAGHDFTNREDTLALYDSTGTLIRPLDLPMTAEERDTSFPKPTTTNFVNHGESVIAYRVGTRDAILEIGERDTVREIPLALPPGAVISGMVASDSSFIVHSFPGMVPGKPVDTVTGVYYEFDPLDGSLLRILKSGNPLVSNIACKANGEFTAFITNKDRQFIRMTAPE